MSRSESFWSECQAVLSQFDLLKHPFYQAWSCGELTLEDLRFYAADYYHHVAAFPTYLTALHSRLPDGKLRRRILANAVEEEIKGPAHSELWLDFAESVGGNRAEIKSSSPGAGVAVLTDTFRLLAEQAEPVTALAAFYAYESQVPRVAKEKSAGLRRWYAMEDKACAYFDLHVTADEYHSRVWANELDAALSDGADEQAALDGIRRGAAQLWKALDDIERKRMARAA